LAPAPEATILINPIPYTNARQRYLSEFKNVFFLLFMD
jgi:hypothetical protein